MTTAQETQKLSNKKQNSKHKKMIFELKQNKDKFLTDCYKQSMKDLNKFYGINWVRNIPKIFIVKTKEDKNLLRGSVGENFGAEWDVGWTLNNETVFVMDRLAIKFETSHKKGYSKEQYKIIIKHELSHLFSKVLIKNGYRPIWLWEGLLSIQLEKINLKIDQMKLGIFWIFTMIIR